MNTERISSTARHLAGMLVQAWGKLTGDAWRAESGRRMQDNARTQLRDNAFSEQSARDMREFLHRNRDWNRPGGNHHA